MNKELEQAMALREEAQEALALARQFNEESKNRQQESAGLLKKCRSIIEMVNNPNPAPMERDIYDIVHAINVLAMANTDVVFIFTQFSAHVQGFEVYAISPQAYYSHDAPYPRLINKTVYLHWDNALERLLAIESQLTELIIEAREAAVTPATEQAEVKA
ncbi:hypothetical protein QXB71_003701 [Vibrio cholerae]|nr:hypothetical protein [Vibrio cholerae]